MPKPWSRSASALSDTKLRKLLTSCSRFLARSRQRAEAPIQTGSVFSCACQSTAQVNCSPISGASNSCCDCRRRPSSERALATPLRSCNHSVRYRSCEKSSRKPSRSTRCGWLTGDGTAPNPRPSACRRPTAAFRRPPGEEAAPEGRCEGVLGCAPKLPPSEPPPPPPPPLGERRTGEPFGVPTSREGGRISMTHERARSRK
mmetsp:Transcript_53175/g.172969  ORF Transcript_53175/g.172969 Transcript_53175/m.172969 type:complete len:202 (+) Transcript_53175:676-1281(+)